MGIHKKPHQKLIDEKAVVAQKATGADDPGGEDKIDKNNIGVTAQGKPVFRGIRHAE